MKKVVYTTRYDGLVTFVRYDDGQWFTVYSIQSVFDRLNKNSEPRERHYSPYNKKDLWQVGQAFGKLIEKLTQKYEKSYNG